MRAREAMNRDGGKGEGRRKGGREGGRELAAMLRRRGQGERGGEALTHRLKILFAEKVG